MLPRSLPGIFLHFPSKFQILRSLSQSLLLGKPKLKVSQTSRVISVYLLFVPGGLFCRSQYLSSDERKLWVLLSASGIGTQALRELPLGDHCGLGLPFKGHVSFLHDCFLKGQTCSSCFRPAPWVASVVICGLCPPLSLLPLCSSNRRLLGVSLHPGSPSLSCLLTLVYCPSAYIALPYFSLRRRILFIL